MLDGVRWWLFKVCGNSKIQQFWRGRFEGFGEIENLKWQDINFDKNILCILEQKNGDKSYIPINELVKQVLMNIRRVVDSPYVFCKNNGEPYVLEKVSRQQ